MKFGDNSWLCQLEKQPDLNGRRVVLQEWLQERQRWKVIPHGWTANVDTLAVRPKNLSNTPPAPGALRASINSAEAKTLERCLEAHKDLAAWARERGVETPRSVCKPTDAAEVAEQVAAASEADVRMEMARNIAMMAVARAKDDSDDSE